MARNSKKKLKEKAERLSNSRPLDVHKISEHPKVKAAVQQLFDEMSTGRQDRRVSEKNLRRHLQTIILDLYVAYRYDPEMYIGFSLNKNKYAPGTRLHKLLFKYSLVKKVCEFLKKRAYIEHVPGHYAKPGTGKKSHQSRMKATNKLIDLMNKQGIQPAMIEHEQDESRLIILKGFKDENGNAEEIEYEDTPETIKMKENLQLINTNNRKHAILPYLKDATLIALSKKMNRQPGRGALDFSHKYLHRVFNNGSWKQGGRFYGPFWQGMPRELRQFIRINDKEVVECDFSGMHINMLYAWEHLPMPEGDVYHLDDYSNNATFRTFLKKLLLIIVNSKNRAEARNAIYDEVYPQRKKTKKQEYSYKRKKRKPEAGLILPAEVKSTAAKDIYPLLDAFEQKHQPISKYFCTGIGIDLQYWDSVIAEKVLLHFTRWGYAILPMHDGFIIHHGLENDLKTAMKDAFREVFGVECNVKLEYNAMTERQERDKRKQKLSNEDDPEEDFCETPLEELFAEMKLYSIYYSYLDHHWSKQRSRSDNTKNEPPEFP